MNKSIVLIPARAGSKGILRKNLKLVKGRELTIRTIIHALKMNSKSSIVLSTNDLKIFLIVEKFFGLEPISKNGFYRNKIVKNDFIYFHFRSEDLSSDDAHITKVLSEVRRQFETENIRFTTWCLLQPTSPFRSLKELRDFGKILDSNSNKKYSSFSVTRVPSNHPARMYTLNSRLRAKPIKQFIKFESSRRQVLPPVFIRDGGFYVIGDALVKANKQFGKNPVAVIRDFPWSLNIDNSIDLKLAQSVKSSSVKNDPNGEF